MMLQESDICHFFYAFETDAFVLIALPPLFSALFIYVLNHLLHSSTFINCKTYTIPRLMCFMYVVIIFHKAHQLISTYDPIL